MITERRTTALRRRLVRVMLRSAQDAEERSRKFLGMWLAAAVRGDANRWPERSDLATYRADIQLLRSFDALASGSDRIGPISRLDARDQLVALLAGETVLPRGRAGAVHLLQVAKGALTGP